MFEIAFLEGRRIVDWGPILVRARTLGYRIDEGRGSARERSGLPKSRSMNRQLYAVSSSGTLHPFLMLWLLRVELGIASTAYYPDITATLLKPGASVQRLEA